jgi:hypothetical protein
MAAADEGDGTRTRSGMPRRRGNGQGHAHLLPDAHAHDAREAGDDELDAVNRLMGFLREDEA